MKLADHLAQCRTPLIVKDATSGISIGVNGAAEFADRVARCPIRYVLSDDLTRLCTALAYSKGSSTVACADLLHIPAETIWVEWCEAPWRAELERSGLRVDADTPRSGRRGAFIQSSSDGRRGLIRTFWSDKNIPTGVFASSMEAYFDFDTIAGGKPRPMDDEYRPTVTVSGGESGDVLRQCFRFRYELTWAACYRRVRTSFVSNEASVRHALRTIANDIPILLAFILLLGIRSGVSHWPQSFARPNRSRERTGQIPLLDYVEVRSPVLPAYRFIGAGGDGVGRRAHKLPPVQGHLVRRGNKLFWRISLCGSARTASIRTGTVTWSVKEPACLRRQALNNPAQ